MRKGENVSDCLRIAPFVARWLNSQVSPMSLARDDRINFLSFLFFRSPIYPFSRLTETLETLCLRAPSIDRGRSNSPRFQPR
jgi:hypothetical protein